MKKMKIRNKELDLNRLVKSIFCIAVGTGVGIIVYIIFILFNIAIFGWNLGLIFAPLVAGYVETGLANRILNENLGAISAFILFIDTTFYSFILKNPTLGFNIITAGAIIVILQAAFPTLINYIFLVVIGGIISQTIGSLKHISEPMINFAKDVLSRYREETEEEIKSRTVPHFDESESNHYLNNLNFFFLTSTDMNDKKHKVIGNYQAYVIIENDRKLIHLEPERAEKEFLKKIKHGKDECLTKLSNEIKNDKGNGILNLSIKYNLVSIKGDIQISATGMGLYII